MTIHETISQIIVENINDQHPELKAFAESLETHLPKNVELLSPVRYYLDREFDIRDYTKNDERAVKFFFQELYHDSISKNPTLQKNAEVILDFFLNHPELQAGEDKELFLSAFFMGMHIFKTFWDNNQQLSTKLYHIVQSNEALSAPGTRTSEFARWTKNQVEEVERKKRADAHTAKLNTNMEEIYHFIVEALNNANNVKLQDFSNSLIKRTNTYNLEDDFGFNMVSRSKAENVNDFFKQLFSDATTPDETGQHPITVEAIHCSPRSLELAQKARTKAIAEGRDPNQAIVEAAKERKQAATEILKFFLNSEELQAEHKGLIRQAFMQDFKTYKKEVLNANNPELAQYMAQKFSEANTWANRVTADAGASLGRS